MTQMMEQTIRNEDYYTLQHIVEQADRKHLNQSRIHKHPYGSNLNILRVLSSFKELFPSTPDRIYKLLMMITKNHNPQTKEQWTKAIEKLNSFETKHNRSSISLLDQESQIRIRSNSQIQTRKNSNYQPSIKTYKQELDNEIDAVVSKRSRTKFVGDFRVTDPSFDYRDQNKENSMHLNNKNSLRNSNPHYISFQPYQKDFLKQTSQLPNYLPSGPEYNIKQNYSMPKKINPYYEITRIDNLSRIEDHQPLSKDDAKTLYSQNYRTQQNSFRCLPSRIQRDQSQTQIIGLDSKNSEISIKKSRLVRNQKFQEVSEYEFYNMTIDQWESLNQKANTLYGFNLKLKAFSSLLANYQAFEQDKFLKYKAKVFNNSYLESKVFLALKANLQFQQSMKQKFTKAQKFQSQNLYRKVWKVLEVMKNLKIEKPKKQIEIQHLNRVNYEFFMSFMFAQKSNFQHSPNKISVQSCQQPFEFENKVQYFSRTQNFENVWDIYKYFGLNINISKEKFGQFFNNYHQTVMKQSFLALKSYHQNRRLKYLKLHEIRLTEKVFSILLSRKQIAQNLKEKLLKASTYATNKLKQKTYKILLSIVYSTKIFSKRQEYIKSQKINRTKMIFLEKWIGSYQNNLKHKKLQKNKLEKMYEIVKKFILKQSFENIRSEADKIQTKIIEVEALLQGSMKRRIFSKLSKIFGDKKKYFELRENSSKNFQKKMLRKWLRLVKLKFSLTKLLKNYKKIIFRNLFVPMTHEIKQDYLLNLQAQKRLAKLCFQHWKQEKTINDERIRNFENQYICYFTNKNSKYFLDMLRINEMENIMLRKRQQINQKVNILKNELYLIKIQYLMQNLNANLLKKSMKKDCITKLRINMKKNALNKILCATEYKKLLEENSNKLQSYKKSQSLQDICAQLQRNQLQAKQKLLQKKVQKKIFSNFLVQVSQKYRNLKDLGQRGENYHKMTIQRKTLLTLAHILIDSTEKSHELTEVLSKQRKYKYFSIFKQRSQQQIRQKATAKIIEKRQLFVGLRENMNLKSREKELKRQLIMRKISQTIQILMQNVLVSSQSNITDELGNKLKKKQFWMRFNQYFIDSLFQKKHTFMAYKFRALKLYKIAFKGWKKSTLGALQDAKSRSKLSKSLQKQNFFNHRQKQVKTMFRQTDCSITSK